MTETSTMIVARCNRLARALAEVAPQAFGPLPLERISMPAYADRKEPPEVALCERFGPVAACIVEHEYRDDHPAGSMSWARSTVAGGVYISTEGTWFRAEETGTGRVELFGGRLADCDVRCKIAYAPVDAETIAATELRFVSEQIANALLKAVVHKDVSE